MKRTLIFLSLLFLLLPASTVFSQGENPVSDDEVNRLAEELYCPVCENVPLDVCPTKACAQWRELIREKIALGWSDEEIKAFFAEQYGDQVLAVPPRVGINWLFFALPPLILFSAAAIVISALLYSRRAKARPLLLHGETSAAPMDEFVRQVEDDLREDE